MIFKHKKQRDQKEITSNKTSNESHSCWKNLFRKYPLYFRIICDFEPYSEIDNSKIGNKTTNNYKQSSVCNGYYVVSKLNNVLKSGYYESWRYNNVDWFVNEVIKMTKKIDFSL